MGNSITQVPVNIYKVPKGSYTVLAFYNKGIECWKNCFCAFGGQLSKAKPNEYQEQ